MKEENTWVNRPDTGTKEKAHAAETVVKETNAAETKDPNDYRKDLFWRGCPGPLPDGTCRTPEETCNSATCSARG